MLDPDIQEGDYFHKGDSLRKVLEISCTDPVEIVYALYRLHKGVPNKKRVWVYVRGVVCKESTWNRWVRTAKRGR